MKQYTLTSVSRDLVGRKVKNLRAEGSVPATIYGRDTQSRSVTIPTDAFLLVYKEAGETGVVDLSVDGVMVPVLIHHVQKHPVSRKILHVEFHAVKLTEKVKADVPLETVGESPAVANHVGVLMMILNTVEVEALPRELPEKIAVDISQLADVGQELRVSDLPVPSGVTVLSDTTLTVVKIASLVTKEAEAQEAADVAASAEAKAEGASEGAASGTGESKETLTDEKKPQEEKK